MPRTVLVVDDSEVNRRILQRMLSAEYNVLEAEDGQEATLTLLREHQRISAVLLDIIMPVMDGYGVLERMRENPLLSQIPVIVTTGSTDLESEKRALDLGANDFVGKPLDAGILMRRLDNLIRLRETSAMVNTYQKDKLTGLLNRETFFERAARDIQRHEAGYYYLSCVDIDSFKLVNDRYGSEKGDEVLKALAEVLREDCAITGGLCGRISADNFITLSPRRLMESSDTERRRREREMIERLHVSVTLSIGRYVVTDKSLDVSAMYDRAKLAQDTVKGRFDAHVAVYDESMRARLVREREITGEMTGALAAGQFEAWYQPQYDHATGALIGAEALARWRHPERGMIAPSEFIPVFERSGFIYELDKYIWEDVCAHLRRWTDEGRDPLPVSVNISRYDLFREDLVSVIVSLTEKYKLSEDMLRLEITESAFAESTQHVVDVVKALISRGFTVEIDDFGSGYSSLNTLKEVPAQILKLDMRFLDSRGNTDRGGNILESIVRMSKWLGMSVIAEGVERRSQADYLGSIGCTYIQGYLYARPMPAADYERLARSIRREERLIALETAENLDNNAFWNPDSLDSLMFNSYVGAACIFEYVDGRIELMRSTELFAETISGGVMSVPDTLRLDWNRHLDEESARLISAAILRSQETGRAASAELTFEDLPGRSDRTYVRATLRVIATAGERRLVYTLIDNITPQRAAEQKEREVASQMQAIMDNVMCGVAAMTITDGRIDYIFFNEQYCGMFGYTREQFLAECPGGMIDITLPEDVAGVEALSHANETREGTTTVEYRCRCRDGSLKWVRASGSICHLRGVETPVHVAVLYDITNQKSILNALRTSETEYRLAVELGGRLVYRYDHAARSIELAENVAPLFGMPERMDDMPESMLRTGLVAEESIPSYREFYAAMRRGDPTGKMTIKRLVSDGSWRWFSGFFSNVFDGDGQPISAIVVFQDVTEQREKEAVYQRWQQSLDEKRDEDYTLFRWNLIRDSMIGKPKGSLMHFRSDAMESSFDQRTEEFVTKYVLPEDRVRYLSFVNIDAMLASYYRGKHYDKLEYRCLMPDGRTLWQRVTVELLEYPNSEDVCAHMLYENIDDAKRQELLVHEQAELDPLTGVLNRATFAAKMALWQSEMSSDAECALMLLDVDGFKLLNDSFGHAAGDQALIDMAEALRSILRPTDLLGRLGGDEFLIGLKSMTDDRIIERKAKQICALLAKSYSPQVQLSVSIGIAICPRDGHDFETAYRKADAALYAVKESGKNSFAFYRPWMAGGTEHLAEPNVLPDTTDARSAAARRRVLIVEDNSLDAQVLANMLGDEFTVVKAKSGSEALVRIRHYGTALSAVLLDLFMPGMDGFDVLEKLRENPELSSVPVIIVSASDDRDTTLRAIRGGAVDYITKPADPEIISTRIRSAISKAENERLRAQNSYLSMQSREVVKFRRALDSIGMTVMELDWKERSFTYDASVSKYIAGVYDKRRLLQIFLSDLVADAQEVRELQELMHDIASDRGRSEGGMTMKLKTPSGEWHSFSVKVLKLADELLLTDKLILTFTDLDI